MKKAFLIFSVCTAMIACTESPKGEESTNTEEHSHEHTSTEDDKVLTDDRTMAPEGAEVMFLNIEDGASLVSPIHVEMGIMGMNVEPAGTIIEGSGHHHLLINNPNGYLERGVSVPMNATNIHFGKGQTEYDLTLEPGEYSLTLQFANGYHESYGKPLSKTIFVNVVEP